MHPFNSRVLLVSKISSVSLLWLCDHLNDIFSFKTYVTTQSTRNHNNQPDRFTVCRIKIVGFDVKIGSLELLVLFKQ